MLRRNFGLTFALWFITAGILHAQATPGPLGTDSVTTAIVPVVSYSSNEGVIGGVIFNRYDYRGNIEPFNNYLQSTAIASTKGFVEIKGKYEQNRSFGYNLRSIVEGYFRRYTTDIFFGIGNQTEFSKSRWEDDYYYFESVGISLSYKIRKPIFSGEAHKQLDFLGGLATEYHIPYVKERPSSFSDEMPNGYKGGWVNTLNAGLVWENRDSEFDPHRGNRAEVDLYFSPKLISTYGLTAARLELRQYFYLFNWLTIANRLESRLVAGDVPYWELSTLGGENNLRGYPLNRFQGKASVAYSLELRAWFIEFPDWYNLKFGGHLFTDTGRVFTGRDDAGDLFSGYKQTVGFGGTTSIFSPDFILRGEIGFSEDVNRIYIGIGYLF